MARVKKRNIFTIILVFLTAYHCRSQNSYSFTTQSKIEDCTKGAAGIQVAGLQQNDNITLTWSNGQVNVYSIGDLNAGEYWVRVEIKDVTDTTFTNKVDSTFTFAIEKQECEVRIANHFTPNGDNYNDTWSIGNTQYYPQFELYVFNKWGQQVHSQKNSYTPWDGKWAGINVPDGTYYYVFYFEGKGSNKLLKGDVTILR